MKAKIDFLRKSLQRGGVLLNTLERGIMYGSLSNGAKNTYVDIINKVCEEVERLTAENAQLKANQETAKQTSLFQ